jgi:hydroxyacylglutathione hydrolase
MFDVIRIPAFKDNYIWLLRSASSAVVVDPGDAQPVLDVLKREALSLVAILITHHHADHQGGVDGLLAHRSAEVFGPATESITGITKPLSGGETINIAPLGGGHTGTGRSRTYARTPGLFWRGMSFLWRHAVRWRLWSPL